MTEYEIITYVKSFEVVFDSNIEAKKYLELIRELDSESVHVLNPIEPTELLCDYDELIEDVKNGFVIDTNVCNSESGSDCGVPLYDISSHTPIRYIKPDSTNQCPECKSDLMHSGGCVSCQNCGYSKCD